MFQNVRITPDNAENSIVVYSNQEDYRLIERSLREIDRPRLQVAIDATVAEVTLTDALQFGVQYFFSNNNSSSVGSNHPGAATAPQRPRTNRANGTARCNPLFSQRSSSGSCPDSTCFLDPKHNRRSSSAHFPP